MSDPLSHTAESQESAELVALGEARFLQEVLSNASEGICFVRKCDGILVYANQASAAMFGYAVGEMIGKHVSTFHVDDGSAGNREVAPGVPDCSEWRGDVRSCRKDGSHFWTHVITKAFDHPTFGKIFVSLKEDITARKEAEASLSAKTVELEGSRRDLQCMLGRLNHAHQELQESREQLRALLARQHHTQDLERIAISREIHDELGQLLTGLKMELRGIENGLSANDSLRGRNALLDRSVSASAIVDTMIESIKKIAAELRPGFLDKQGLVDALIERGARFQSQCGVRCDVEISTGDRALPSYVEAELYHICREALTNVARHAHANKVLIRLSLQDDLVVLEVQDDGRGVSEVRMSPSRCLGIIGMKERALYVGGTLVVERCAPTGTIVTARVPIKDSLSHGGIR